MDKAWARQSVSLIRVQKMGSGLENHVREALGWPQARIVYDFRYGYSIQADAVYPSEDNPNVVISITYTKPDTRGHSNENKLQLKLGELALLKSAYPDIAVVLVLGGDEDAWLKYVLLAFKYFFDEVIFLWSKDGLKRLREIKESPECITRKHDNYWTNFRNYISNITWFPLDTPLPSSLVRYTIADKLRKQFPKVHHPELIENEIGRYCMSAAKRNEGKEWQNFVNNNWNALEMSRNYFNPVEASVELSLIHAGVEYQGGMARDVQVRSFLHELDMHETSLSEDFVLMSEARNMPVYIQCKASGGGRKQHGKNIQNRTKEQLARSLLYRSRLVENNIIFGKKEFYWISVLDGNWGVNNRTPLKYLHMLQMAGYDKIISARSLLTDDMNLKRDNNPLINIIVNELKCKRQK